MNGSGDHRNKTSGKIPVLARLLEKGGEFVSGQELADNLGLSRMAIHKSIRGLKEEGLEIEAISRRGYRMGGWPSGWSPSFFHAQVLSIWPQATGLFLKICGSTNSEAERWLLDHPEASGPVLILANEQSSGRGRRHRAWISAPGEGLLLSVGWRPSFHPSRLSLITVWLGCFIAKALREKGLDIGLKWPNDLWSGDRKLAGMLAESRLSTDTIQSLVFGIGLNLSNKSHPADLQEQTIGLDTLDSHGKCPHYWLAALLESLRDGMRAFLSLDVPAALPLLWDPLDVLHGRRIQMEGDGETLSGVASGIDSGGRLRVRISEETERCFSTGDVRLIRPIDPKA